MIVLIAYFHNDIYIGNLYANLIKVIFIINDAGNLYIVFIMMEVHKLDTDLWVTLGCF